MKNRSPIAVLLLPFVTLGIYSIYWYVSTKGELNKRGAQIPTAWLIIVPLFNIWWLWKYSEGVEKVTSEKTNSILAFLLLWIVGMIGQAIIQDSFNKVGGGEAATAAEAPQATAETTEPTPPAAPAA